MDNQPGRPAVRYGPCHPLERQYMSRAPRRPRLVLRDGKEISDLQIDVLRAAQQASPKDPVGSLKSPWRHRVIRALEDRGMILVLWLESGDTGREGAWQVHGITEIGEYAIEKWDARIGAQEQEK